MNDNNNDLQLAPESVLDQANEASNELPVPVEGGEQLPPAEPVEDAVEDAASSTGDEAPPTAGEEATADDDGQALAAEHTAVNLEIETPIELTPATTVEADHTGPIMNTDETSDYECVEGVTGPNGEECGTVSIPLEQFCLRNPFDELCKPPHQTPDPEEENSHDLEATTQSTTTSATPPAQLAETGTIDPTTLIILGTAALAAGVGLLWRERVVRARRGLAAR